MSYAPPNADDKRAEARRLRAEGHTYAEIGRRLGVSGVMASKYMRHGGHVYLC